jgi:TnpA family transposase
MEPIASRYLGWSDLPADLTQVEIEVLFTLSPSLISFLGTRRSDLSRLGLALQVCYVRMSGRLLGSTKLVSSEILATLARQLDIRPPMLASMRSLYRRRQTRYDHQKEAVAILGLKSLSAGSSRQLGAYLSEQAARCIGSDSLMHDAMTWLHRHEYLLPPRRGLEEIVARARERADQKLIVGISRDVPDVTCAQWISQLSERKSGRRGLFEALLTTPKGRSVSVLEAQTAKIAALRDLGADRLTLGGLSPALIAQHAAMVSARPASRIGRVSEPYRTIQIACFLHERLFSLSDQAARMADHLIARLWGQARRLTEEQDRGIQAQQQAFLLRLTLAASSDMDDAAFGALARSRLNDAGPILITGRLSRIRQTLLSSAKDLRRIGRATSTMRLELEGTQSKCATEFFENQTTEAADKALAAAGRTWTKLATPKVDLLNLASVASAMMLKRCLRNGSIGIAHSIEHRSPQHRLIPESQWPKTRRTLIRETGLPATSEAFLNRLKPALEIGLNALAKTVDSGGLTIADGRLVVPKLNAEAVDPKLRQTRLRAFGMIGKVQLPDILIEIDAITGFSSLLIGQEPAGDQDLVVRYAALLALGSDLTPASVCRMINGVEPKAVSRMVERIIAGGKLRQASDAILAFMRGHTIADLWGSGITASADMLSLETARHLWSARTDPRRQTASIGSYTHILDQWAILYDQPVLLGRRQTGVAIEGALRQNSIPHLEQLAVDTHGHTHFGMALAKLCGLDLCPRLAGISHRSLYLPTGMAVPESIKSIASPTIKPKDLNEGWDGLLRLAASVRTGHCPATFAMDWYGSAARGQAIHTAGTQAGKLLLTLYLCDYLTKLDFQRQVGKLLSQGEAVHTLQRALISRPLAPRSGRDQAELTAISGAMSLLANIIMAWNTSKLDALKASSPALFPNNHMAHIAPITHSHINMRGMMTFDFTAHREALFKRQSNQFSNFG